MSRCDGTESLEIAVFAPYGAMSLSRVRRKRQVKPLFQRSTGVGHRGPSIWPFNA
jgi:hypothetical protein